MCRDCLRQSAACQKYRQHKIIKTMNETGGGDAGIVPRLQLTVIYRSGPPEAVPTFVLSLHNGYWQERSIARAALMSAEIFKSIAGDDTVNNELRIQAAMDDA